MTSECSSRVKECDDQYLASAEPESSNKKYQYLMLVLVIVLVELEGWTRARDNSFFLGEDNYPPAPPMNVLRHSLCRPIHRAYSTSQAFIPPVQLRNIERTFQGLADRGGNSRGQSRGGRRRRKANKTPGDDEDGGNPSEEFEGIKTKPDSPSFYTGRPVYYDQVIQLQKANSYARGALKTLQLLPLPAFARKSLPPLRPVWKNQDEMRADFESKMTTARYRRVTILLNELNDYLRIATTAGCTDLAEGIGQIVAMFESGKKDAFLARGQRKKVVLDSYGRSYTVGKRKTSSARVWMIPVRAQSQLTTSQREESIEELFGIQPPSPPPVTVTTTTVLVNNLPLAEYFRIPADRERTIRPFKIAGVLGGYNVFALLRGGGSTGQSGALAHGIAKGLVAHEPELDKVLRRGKFLFSIAIANPLSSSALSAKLMRRDPRMVERKKTGLAKARKRVSIFFLLC
jgi:small subunit ribosomal protein S9